MVMLFLNTALGAEPATQKGCANPGDTDRARFSLSLCWFSHVLAVIGRTKSRAWMSRLDRPETISRKGRKGAKLAKKEPEHEIPLQARKATLRGPEILYIIILMTIAAFLRLRSQNWLGLAT